MPSRLTSHNETQFVMFGPGDGIEYEHALRSSFEFMRRMGRYTARTLSAVLNAADRAESARISGREAEYSNMPVVLRAERVSRYDEETEVKYGGVVGVCIGMPAGDDRLLLAVHSEHRRHGVGAMLVGCARNYHTADPVAWVGTRNTVGQMFLLAQGWTPTSLNGGGAICYSPSLMSDPVEEDPFAAVPSGRRGRRGSLRFEEPEPMYDPRA